MLALLEFITISSLLYNDLSLQDVAHAQQIQVLYAGHGIRASAAGDAAHRGGTSAVFCTGLLLL